MIRPSKKILNNKHHYRRLFPRIHRYGIGKTTADFFFLKHHARSSTFIQFAANSRHTTPKLLRHPPPAPPARTTLSTSPEHSSPFRPFRILCPPCASKRNLPVQKPSPTIRNLNIACRKDSDIRHKAIIFVLRIKIQICRHTAKSRNTISRAASLCWQY